MNSRTEVYFGKSGELGQIGLKGTVRALYLYQYNHDKPIEARFCTIPWAQIVDIKVGGKVGPNQLRIKFKPGQAFENMPEITEQLLTVQINGFYGRYTGVKFIAELVQYNCIRKASSLFGEHYRPNGIEWFVKRGVWQLMDLDNEYETIRVELKFFMPYKPENETIKPGQSKAAAVATVSPTLNPRSSTDAVSSIRNEINKLGSNIGSFISRMRK